MNYSVPKGIQPLSAGEIAGEVTKDTRRERDKKGGGVRGKGLLVTSWPRSGFISPTVPATQQHSKYAIRNQW